MEGAVNRNGGGMHFPSVLVLGATGRIGTFLRKSWSGTGPLWQTRGAAPGPGWVRIDPLADAAGLARAAQGRAAILCLAGVVPGQGGDLADNARLARAAVRAGAAAGARVLLTSSAAVYGARGGLLSETTEPLPASDYGRAKVRMEAEAADLAAGLGVEVTALRIGNIAGVDAILGGWRPGFALDRFADGRTPRRSYIGVQSLARVLADLAGQGGLPGVLNLAAPGAVEMGALLDAAGLGWTPRPAPDTAIPEVVLDISRLAGVTALAAGEGRPETLVAQWRALGAEREERR